MGFGGEIVGSKKPWCVTKNTDTTLRKGMFFFDWGGFAFCSRGKGTRERTLRRRTISKGPEQELVRLRRGQDGKARWLPVFRGEG